MPRGGIRVDAEQYARVRVAARDFDQLLDKELKRALKEAGRIGADAAKTKIRAMPATGGHGLRHGTVRRPQGLRAKLAANIRVAINDKDVRIIQGVAGISGRNARGLPKRIDEGSIRHPVYGNRRVWVTQMGWPYFKDTIERKRPEMEDKVADALDRAVRVIEGRL